MPNIDNQPHENNPQNPDLKVFEQRVNILAQRYRGRRVEYTDKAWQCATALGLENETDAVQIIMNAAFAKVGNGHDETRRVNETLEAWDEEPIPYSEEEQPPPKPKLSVFRASVFEGLDLPNQEWTMTGLIPARQVCLLSGHGATGKSTIALHLCAAHALGRMWLNYEAIMGPALFIDAEDDVNVIHRRLAAVVRHYGVSFKDLHDLHLMSLVGHDSLLARPDRDGILRPTPLYDRLLNMCEREKYKQVVVASAANVFAGNENDRVQVTRFISMMTKLAMTTGGSVILITHPSVSAMGDGRGTSGSTAWHNMVRTQIHLERSTNGSDDTGYRKLVIKKNQYGPDGDAVAVKWQDGMFLPEASLSDYEKAAKDQKADTVFMGLFREAKRLGTPLSPVEASQNYAPRSFAKEEAAKGCTEKDLRQSMLRAIEKGTITIKEKGPPSRRTPCLEFP
jgi:hypothetical protein